MALAERPRATVASYRPHTVFPRHSHRFASLSLVFDGGCVERFGRRSWRFEPWSLLYRPPDFEHANVVGPGGIRALFVEIPERLTAAWADGAPRLSEARGLEPRVSRAMFRWARDLVHRDRGNLLEPVDHLVDGMLAAVAGRQSDRPTRDGGAWLELACEFIRAHCRRPTTLTEVARVVGVHPVHLAQRFRRVKGCTFREYLREVRLDAARLDLRDPSRTIGAIALGAGFADHAHFSRAFRARFGQTPKAYRQWTA